MAEALLVLGQAIANGAQQLIYTAPAATQAAISNIAASNKHASLPKGIGIWVVPSGETLSDEHNIVPDGYAVQPKNPFTYLGGVTLATGDRIYVKGEDANVSFSVFGAQVT